MFGAGTLSNAFQCLWGSLHVSLNASVPLLYLGAIMIMAALHSKCEHYIIVLWFLLSIFFFFFFPRLFSAVADWMSTILPHMVWP